MSQLAESEDNLKRFSLQRIVAAVVLGLGAWLLVAIIWCFELVSSPQPFKYWWSLTGLLGILLFGLSQSRWLASRISEQMALLMLFYGYALWFGWLLSFMPELRPALSSLFYALLLLAMLSLPLASMLLLAGFCLVVYGGVVLYSIGFQNQLLDPAIELLQWLIIATLTLCFGVGCTYVLTLHEVCDRRSRALKASRDRIETLVHFDELTGLLKRRFLLKAMEHEQSQVRLGRRPFALCLLDVDQFSYINEYYGYRTGDEVLRTLAELLKELLSGNELLARFNGEEFLLLLPETDADTAMARVSFMRSQIAKHVFLSPHGSFSVCFSAGVSCYEAHASVDDLLGRVKQALGMAQNNQYNQSQYLPLNQPQL